MTHQPNNVSAAGVLLPESPEAFALRMLVTGGLVSQEKVDSALSVAAKFRAHDNASAHATVRAESFVLRALIAAGHVSQDKVDKAFRIAENTPGVSASSPAAREAGDGVTLTAAQCQQIINALGWSPTSEEGLAHIETLRAILREAGSR